MKRFVFTFRSSSSPGRTYEAVKTIDASYSQVVQVTCNCPGWARRVQPDGSRMCVHTRLIQSGDPSKDPLFVSCDPPLSPSLPSFRYPTPDYMPVESMGAENFAPLSVRRRVIFFDKFRIPTSWGPYFDRVGRCNSCSNFHFPEYENCALLEPRVVKIKPVAKAEPEPTTKPQRRKFNFDE